MSMIEDCTTTKPPSTSSRSSCFLGCFGCSGEKMQLPDEVKSGSRRRWISKWKFNFKKSAAKTVPVDHTTTVSRKSKMFRPAKKRAPATADTEIQVVEEDAKLTKKPVIMDGNRWLVEDAGERTVMLDDTNKQYSRRKKSTDSDKRQNGSCGSRRKERKAAAATAIDAAALSRPGSPRKKSVTVSHSVVSSPLKPLTHSISLSPPKRKKPPPTPPAGGGVNEGTSYKPTSPAGRVDSLIGMSIILVTLVIMMLWGKLCAILCTCAWFFIAPRLGNAVEHSGIPTAETRLPESHNNLDLESVEYKKKVVLEGLLQRNHRNVVGRL